MKPLSSWTYNSRHKRRAALLLGLVLLVTAGVYITIAVIWSVFIEEARLSYMSLSEFSLVTPGTGSEEVIAEIESNPYTARILPTKTITINLPTMIPGETNDFRLFGLYNEDLPFLLETFNATLIDGRLPNKGANELLLSKEIAAILNMEVGDTYEMLSAEFYKTSDSNPTATEMIVAGILESDVRLGIVSLNFLNSHNQYRDFPSRFLVASLEGQQPALDEFLRNQILSDEVGVQTLSLLNQRIRNEVLPGLALLTPAILIVTLAFAQVVVVVNRIANLRRLPEFGVLNATGHSIKVLIRRLTTETATLTLGGWVAGIGAAWLILVLINTTMFLPRGYNLSFLTWLPLVFVFPIPAAVVGFTNLQVKRTFAQLDPVAVIEQKELSQEGKYLKKQLPSESLHKPLNSVTYYRRHRRQTALVIGIMGIVIFAVTLIIFILGISADARETFIGYLHEVSLVRSPGIVHQLDPTIAAQIKTHPSVERVIPVAPRFHMASAWIPPFDSAEASPFTVYSEDLAYLVKLYDLQLKEGHLPRPGSNEIVIPESLAKNRNLTVGDVIGDADHPAYPGAEALRTTFVISGIFAKPPNPEDENWWGFISLEFIENEGVFPIPENPALIVVPKPGEKQRLDDWLKREFSGNQASVLTYELEISRVRQSAQNQIFSIVMVQAIIAIIAALGIAVLNHIYITQRQAEFGMLHALGYKRSYLVGRVLREYGLITLIAWGLSAALTLLVMAYLRFGVYEPIGLSFNLLRLTPWLYTLPIPVVVLIVTAITTARTLSKLDPIAIIERRS
jgi:putative ABC transport system permease protein